MSLTKTTIKLALPLAISLALAACGGSSSDSSSSNSSNVGFGSNTSTDTTDTDDTPTAATGTTDTTDTTVDEPGTLVETPELSIGNKVDDNFSEGALFVANSTLPPGGSTGIKAWILDPEGLPYPGTMTASVLSDCIADGLAYIDQPEEFTTGVITANYIATGCRDSDNLTMRVNYEGQTYTATADITVEPPVIGSVRYDSASVSNIGIKGVGLDEVSTLKFQVMDDNGNPVALEDVRFKLNTNIGGIRVLPEIGQTDDEGFVTVDVHSGTVSTSVKVTAEVVSKTSVFTQSRSLVISTGIADQNSISISAERFNPEAFDYDGDETTISILASDHFNNPVPDDTAVFFTAEGGQIEPQCLTTNGGCSVTWRSSNPRPEDGRVTILASLLGEESFSDKNGNGLLDDGESFDDLGIVFRDDNEDGVYNGTEELRDSNANGVNVASDGEYNGILCNPENTVNKCSDNKNIFVNKSIVLVMSTSHATFQVADSVQIPEETGATFPLLIADEHEQPLPEGTKIEFEIDGDVVKPLDPDNIYAHKLISDSERIISNSNAKGFTTFNVTISDDYDGEVDSFLKIKVTTPKGNVTEKVISLKDQSNQVIVNGEAGEPTTILFEEAQPSAIGIRGFGLNEISQVRFRIVDEQGRVVQNQMVNFSLSSSLGGATIQPSSAETDEDGYVLTTVRAGTLATTVKVLAEVANFPTVYTQSRGLIISTGVADQNSVSLSADVLNPEAWNRDGVKVNLTMHASDHFNNPVPDGTAVNFTSEGGQIQPSCLIENGKCSITWTSSRPYPADHRVTVLATILGEESFADSNGNGVFDDGEKFFDTPEVFRDDNENNVFDPLDHANGIYEESRDYNDNGQYDGKNGLYDGVLCSTGSTLCSNEKNIYANDSVVLVLSDTVNPIQIATEQDNIVFDASTDTKEVEFTVADAFGQPLPAGTTVEIDSTTRFSVNGSFYPYTATIPSTNLAGGTTFNVIVRDQYHSTYNNGAYDGALTIIVNTPRGVTTQSNITLEGYLVPEAISDTAATTANTPVTIEVLNNDLFKGSVTSGDITISRITNVNSGASAIIDGGNIIYTPDPDYIGNDYFYYYISDKIGNEDSGLVTVTISE
jgi:hypothetical protein